MDDKQATDGRFLADVTLGMIAEAVDEIEAARIAQENRLRAFRDLHPDDPPEAFEALLASLAAIEVQAVKQLQKAMRGHLLWSWAQPIKGCGEKQFARLLAAIGDPAWNELHERPRTLRELRAYCGFHVWDDGVAPCRIKGHQSNWNGDARKRAWLIAQKLIQKGDPTYRAVYDKARVKYANTVHPQDCVRCGPSGNPAKAGTPRGAGHQHAMAIRLVAVAFLADLWREAHRLHQAVTEGE